MQEPRRTLGSTFGSVFGSMPAIILSAAADSAKPSMSRTTDDRQRMVPSLSSIAGFSAPTGP